ncbi:hypothetical protein SLA2020_519610 [Shorea laevis]
MGGGNRRNSHGKTRKTAQRSSRTSSSSSSLFVEGGLLSDWQLDARGRNANSGSKSDPPKTSGSKNISRKPKTSANAIRYDYPSLDLQEGLGLKSVVQRSDGDNKMDESDRIVLVDSNEMQIVAYMDQTPPAKPPDVNYTYEYNSSFVLGDGSHRGLGFYDESEATPSGIDSSSKQIEEQEGACSGFSSSEKEMDADEGNCADMENHMDERLLAKAVTPVKNSGFLSIGGMKLYTQDMSDLESDKDFDGASLDDESSESSGQQELDGFSKSDDSEAMSDSDSDIDEEVAEDYLEGIGGSDIALDTKWLVGQVLEESDEDSSSSGCSLDDTLEKLGGIALQDASKEYGMQKVKSRKVRSRAARDVWSPPLDDLMLLKDSRTVSAKKHVTKFPRSWPLEAQKSKTSRRYPGEKKKHRKEMIATKRRQRLLNRGVDLGHINLTLEQIVLDGVDMFCFQRMHYRDCSQVRRLAGIYRLSSSCQGSGKKSFVTVTRTRHTCMPSSSDKLRLEKLIGAGNEDADFAINEAVNSKGLTAGRGRANKVGKGSGLSLQESQQSARIKSSKKGKGNNNGEVGEKKQSGKKSSYANQPVSFVSSGIMEPDTAENKTIDSNSLPEACDSKGVASSTNFGAFEVHTKGFGSKMMARMGFVEGRGLGKDGQGIAEPIEAVKRPKSLGLGVDFSASDVAVKVSNTSGDSAARVQHKTIGAFEKHTKGFGSKMMAKMGFVEGMGLGKDSQGILNPLAPVRRPKSRGLGAKA